MTFSDAELTRFGEVETVPAELRRPLMNGLALLGAGANVIMQLSRLPIGHGVAESSVESGALYAHPIKRTRTTLGYIMIALFGTTHERTVLRGEVNRQHRHVHSDANSDIAYDAFDPELQLWVAACMYRGLEDANELLYGAPIAETLNQLYRHSSRFATTLQVPASMWPADRTAFEDYWNVALGHIAMDDTTRTYLLGLASLSFLPALVGRPLAPLHRLVTTGFLPRPFREELRLPWSPLRQRLFNALCSTVARLNRILPRPLREFPWNIVLFDTRRRIRKGRPIV